MGRTIAAVVIAGMIGLLYWNIQAVRSSETCMSVPEAYSILHKEYPTLQDGPILQNENLVVFMRRFTEDMANGATPPFSFDVIYIWSDPSDESTGVYFFHEGCLQWRGWFPSQDINSIISEAKNG